MTDANLPAELPELSQRELLFCQAVLEGYVYTDAYRQAHPKAAGWKPTTVRVEASRMAARPQVQAYLAVQRRIGMQNGVRSLEGYVAKVVAHTQQAVEAEQFTAVARLVETEGKALGFLGTASYENLAPSLGPDELVITMRARYGAEAGRRLASKLGLLEEAAPVDIEGEAVEVADAED